jgi:hypothetical protein
MKRKIRKLRVLKAGGGRDASKGDFSSGPGPGPGSKDLTGPRELGVTTRTGPTSTGDKGTKTPPVTVNPGPFQVPSPFSYTPTGALINKVSKASFDSKNLKDARKNDLLGGEMLTTGPTNQGPKDRGDNKNLNPPIQAIEATKPIDQTLVSPKDNFFNFVAYKVGGLSGGVSYGPPPKRGPNPQVPPVKMKRGGYKK